MQHKVFLKINNLSFIVSFQGEPGVRGPPGPSGPRGIGTQGPKVSPKVCARMRVTGTISDNQMNFNFIVFILVLTYFFLITNEVFSHIM